MVTGICDPNKSQAQHKHSTVSFRKTSSYKPHLTQYYKKYTPATQLKTLLTLQIFQKTCLWLVSDKTLALHHFYAPKNFIFKARGKQMSTYSCKSPWENFCYRDREFLFGRWGLNEFLNAACCFYPIKYKNVILGI